MNDIPQSLLQEGAIITMPDGYRALVADAQFNGHLLWWFEAFGREHIIEATALVEDGPWIQAERRDEATRDSVRIATLGPNEGWDDAEIWTEWTKFLDTDEGRATAASIAELKSQAATAKE